MNSDLRHAINKLRALSPQLNSAVSEADRVVVLVERFLVEECCLGVEAEVPLQYNDKGKAVTLLRYGPANGTFRITLTNTDGATHFVTRPWVECDRNERMVSFAALPKLLIAITKAVEHQIASTNSTSATVGQIMSALGMPATMPMPRSHEAEVMPASALDGEPELTLLMGGNDGDVDGEPKIVKFSDLVAASETATSKGNSAKVAGQK